MSHPSSPQQAAALSAAFSRAVDLTSLASPAQPPGEPVPDSPHILDVTDATFGAVLEKSHDVPVVVDLWATWCEPCKQLSPILERLAIEGNGSWILAKVDVDANPQIAQAFQAQSIPTVIAVGGGQPLASFSGAQPEPQVRQWITQLLDILRDKLPGINAAEAAADAVPETPEPENPLLTAALTATEEGDFAAAVAAYQEYLAENPQDEEAQSGLRWAEFFTHIAMLPATTIEAAATSHDPVAICNAADIEISRGDAADGFSRLIEGIKASAGAERDQIREHLLQRFKLFVADDPAVVAARRALATALF